MTPASLKVQEYRRTPKGLLTLIYANQKMTSAKAGRPAPQYTKAQLSQWMLSQPQFPSLFDAWVLSGYDKYLSPSVDRIHNGSTYSLTNIRLVTWRQNLENQKTYLKIAKDRTHNMRSVDQLDLAGNYIQTFPSIQMAMRHLGRNGKAATNIASTCNGIWKTAYGYTWRWH